MIFRRLLLRNIRSYADAEIRFPDGTILFSGDIGSGKSTILLAIEFALFGIRRGELSGESLLRHGKSSGEVELEFEIDSSRVIIKRTLKKAKGNIVQDSGYLMVNGRKTEGTPVELKSRIIELLGYPEELLTKSKSLIYRYTVYTPQEEMKQVLYEDREVRLDTLRKVFGIDRYKRMKENIVLFNRELKRLISESLSKIEDLESKVKEKEGLDNEIKGIGTKVAVLEQQEKALSEEIKSRRQALADAEEILRKAQDMRKSFEIISARISEKEKQRQLMDKETGSLSEKILVLQKRIAQFGEIQVARDEAELEKQYSEAQEKLSGLISEKGICEERLSSNDEKARKLTREIEEVSAESKSLMEKKAKTEALREKLQYREKFREKLEELEQKIKDAFVSIGESEVKRLNSSKIRKDIMHLSVCPVCHQEVTSEHREQVLAEEASREEELSRIVEERKKEKSVLEEKRKRLLEDLDKIDRIEKLVLTMEAEAKSLEKSGEKLAGLQSQVTALSAERAALLERKQSLGDGLIDKSREVLEKLKAQLSKAREANARLRERKSISEILSNYSENRKRMEAEAIRIGEEIAAEREKSKVLEEDLREFSRKEKDFADAKRTVDELVSGENRIHVSLAELRSDLKNQEKQLALLLQAIREKESVRKRAEYYRSLNLWIEEHLTNLISLIERQVMLSIYNEFNSLVKEWFSMLIDDMEIKLDEEFTPVIIQNGYETGFENLSGGEKTSVALAYRLALYRVIGDMIGRIRTKDVIILDEPTDGFSSEQLDKIREVLEELRMKQIIIVSHEPKMESFVQHIVRITKDNHASRVI